MAKIDQWAWIREMNLTSMFDLNKSPEVLEVKSELSQGRRSATKAWGDGLVRKVPLVQAEGPKFDLQTGTVAEVYSPSL